MSTTYGPNDASAGAIPVGTVIKTTDTAQGKVQHVNIDTSILPSGGATAANQALELSELQSMNLLSSVVYDEILVTYTDATKAVISKVEWKLASAVVKTLTPTFGVTTDDWVKS